MKERGKQMSDLQNLLVAVNDSDDALRAVQYVGQVAAISPTISVYLFYVYPDPPPDYYTKGGTLDAYKEIMQFQAQSALDLAITSLKRYDVADDRIISKIELADGKSISQSILNAVDRYNCSTLVVGKRGISKNEEFLFGSISNTLARKTKGFTTWIVG